MHVDKPPGNSFQEYRDLVEIVRRYWVAYGGWRDVRRSPYVHASLLVTVVCSGYWITGAWHSVAASLLPNLLGFGVTGYAIWIGWGDEKLRETLMDMDKDTKGSSYVQISAVFAHFGVIQFIALFLALIAGALDYTLSPESGLALLFKFFGLPSDCLSNLRPIGFFVGYFFFIYAIMTALETTLALFRLAGWLQIQRKFEHAKRRARQADRNGG